MKSLKWIMARQMANWEGADLEVEGMCYRERLVTYTSGLDDSVRYDYTMLVQLPTGKW